MTTYSSIREAYQKTGVEKFYKTYGEQYQNPHELNIHQHLAFWLKKHPELFSNVLDLCCGSGEVSDFLLNIPQCHFEGCDPFTYQAYKKRLKKDCYQFSFKDLSKERCFYKKYSLIICSFALHLCPQSLLPNVLYHLSLNADHLLIISPHKKPDIKYHWRNTENEYFLKIHSKLFLNYF